MAKNERANNLRQNERKRSDGRYEFRYVDTDGTRKSVCRKTLRDLREAEAKISGGTFVTSGKAKPLTTSKNLTTVNDLFCLWVPTKINVRENTRQKLYEYYRRYVENTLGPKDVRAVKTSDVKLLYNAMLTEKNLSKSTIKKVHNILKQMYDLGVSNGLVPKNPAENAFKEISQVKQESKSKRADHLTAEEQKELLDFMRSSARYLYWYPAIATVVGTGMRLSEFAGLTWDDVDLESGTIRINHTVSYFYQDALGRSDFVVNDVKTESSKRIIPISDTVREALLMQREFQKNLLLASPTLGGLTDFCFYSSKGRLISEQRINNVIRNVIAAHNAERPQIPLPLFSCHTLRHTFATRLCEAHVAIKAAQSILGHSDFQTTYNIYVGVDDSFVMKEFGKVNDMI